MFLQPVLNGQSSVRQGFYSESEEGGRVTKIPSRVTRLDYKL